MFIIISRRTIGMALDLTPYNKWGLSMCDKLMSGMRIAMESTLPVLLLPLELLLLSLQEDMDDFLLCERLFCCRSLLLEEARVLETMAPIILENAEKRIIRG
jgi:hypothetical protein